MVAARGAWIVVWACVSVLAAEELSERLPVHDSETCVVCSREVAASGAAYLVGGQRIAVCQQCQPAFEAAPGAHIARLRPNSMIFGAQTQSYLDDAWIWLGILILTGILFGGLSAHLAVRKGRPPLKSFLLGFFFSVPAYAFLLLKPASEDKAAPAGMRKVPLTHDPAACPGCGNGNHPAAVRCSSCGAELTAHTASEAVSAREA
ncbi:MAG: hypothetical protein GY953_21020 [bacterium]|nr:hypothetical protein [bacterium]